MEHNFKFINKKINAFKKIMTDISFIYERFISISIRGEFNINNEEFKGIKICLNPNFWPHSFNFKKIDYKKNIKPNPIGKKWNKSLKWIIKQLDSSNLTIQEKKDIFIDWIQTNNELWNKTRKLWKIKDYYAVKLNAWKTLILFLNKYNETKSNIINEKNVFNLYRINEDKNSSNYNSDYILRIDDLYQSNNKNKNYILIFCVKSNLNDLNQTLINNPTKYTSKINYLFLTLKSIQIRNNYDFNKNEELVFSNIFLNERKQ